MDQETLFTSSKWDILQVLSSGQKSPLELARETKTSIANISQQLRMLELANIVKSERVGNRERGEPRLLYSLSGPFSFLISASPSFVKKKKLLLSPHHETILRIWFISDVSSHYFIEKFFWDIESKLDRIDSIIVKSVDFSKISILIVSNDSKLKSEIKSLEIKNSYGEKRRIEISFVQKDQLSKLSDDKIDVIYDPNLILQKSKEETKT